MQTQNLTHTHTKAALIPRSHSGTDDVIHLRRCWVTKALLCLSKHTRSYAHTHTYIRAHSLPVHSSREQAKLNAHVASLCRGKPGRLSFTDRLIHQGWGTVGELPCCHKVTSHFVSRVNETNRAQVRERAAGFFFSDIWRIWMSDRDIWLNESHPVLGNHWQKGKHLLEICVNVF